MFLKSNSVGALAMILALLLVLILCFAVAPIQAGGGGGQWPDPLPPEPVGGSTDGGDGIPTLITAAVLLEVVL